MIIHEELEFVKRTLLLFTFFWTGIRPLTFILCFFIWRNFLIIAQFKFFYQFFYFIASCKLFCKSVGQNAFEEGLVLEIGKFTLSRFSSFLQNSPCFWASFMFGSHFRSAPHEAIQVIRRGVEPPPEEVFFISLYKHPNATNNLIQQDR